LLSLLEHSKWISISLCDGFQYPVESIEKLFSLLPFMMISFSGGKALLQLRQRMIPELDENDFSLLFPLFVSHCEVAITSISTGTPVAFSTTSCGAC
jgi:hypothetical protein